MHPALLCLLLAGLRVAASTTAASTTAASTTAPTTLEPVAAAVQALLAQLAPSGPSPALAAAACAELQRGLLLQLPQLPELPAALARATLALALSRAGCGMQAGALARGLAQELDLRMARRLLQQLAQLRAGRGRMHQLLRLAPLTTGVPVAPCSGLSKVSDTRLWGTPASAAGSLATAAAACHRLQAACVGVTPVGPRAFVAVWRQGSQLLPARGVHARLHRCSSAPRGRVRRDTDDACSPPGEREVHRVLEWVPAASTLYNLGTSLYFAFEGCEALASARAWEAALDLGYDALAVLTAGAGGPVAYGVQLGLQPGLKASVRALLSYYTAEEAPAAAPTAHSGPVRIV